MNEIFSEMYLKERVTMANLTEDSVEVLQRIFDWYIGVKTGLAPGDHRLKVVK